MTSTRPSPHGMLRRDMPRALVAAGMTLLATLGCARQASAMDRQWRAGALAGWMAASFPEGGSGAFGGGAHVGYGISDAFILRLHADVAAFDLPAPASSALMHGAFFGAEYLVDIFDWIPYFGLTAGPVLVSLQERFDAEGGEQPGENLWHLAIEIPAGLGYRLSRHIAIVAEARYRALFLGGSRSPGSGALLLGRFDVTWEL